MGLVWTLFFTFWDYLPWVAIAIMAGLALRRRRESKLLLLQAMGAAGMFVLGIARWTVVRLILQGMNASSNVREQAATIFDFLLFLALCVFAVGYCAERLKRAPKPA